MNSLSYINSLDNLASASTAFYNVAIKRQASQSPSCPHWYEPVPRDLRYPWSEVRVPKFSGVTEAKEISDKIKARGNDYFKRGEYWEALWKYEHGLFISRSFPSLKDDAAALHCNIAAACLKLGIARRLDLLDPNKLPPSIMLWFVYTQQHATEAISRDPPPSIACKAFWRRGESFKEIMNIPHLKSTIENMSFAIPGLSEKRSDSYVQIVYDLLKCVELQKPPDPKIFAEALVLGIDHSHTHLVPALYEHHVKSDFTTQVLLELLKRTDVFTHHLSYLLLKLEIRATHKPHFDGSKVSVSTLLRKRVSDPRIFEKLFKSGMIAVKEDFVLLKELHRLKCLERSVYEFVMSQKEDSPEEQYFKLKNEGNSHFSKGSYEQALGLYYKALNYCRRNGMVDEMATIRSNCAQACLKLQLYSDAYSHCGQCLKLNPASHKGYYRRAEALKAMLESPQETSPPGSYKDVVKDYLESHSHQANPEAFCLAVTLAIDHNCDLSIIPKLLPQNVRSGFSDKVLACLIANPGATDHHLDYILEVWPGFVPTPFKAVSVKLSDIVKIVRDSKIYRRLFDLGMKASMQDVSAVVCHLPEKSVSCLRLILTTIGEVQSEADVDYLNKASTEAIQLEKEDFVLALMEHGATPTRTELTGSKRLRKDPNVMHYLDTTGHPQHDRDVKKDPQKVTEGVAQLTKQARLHFKSGRYPEAIELYKHSADLCEKYDLKKEAVTTRANLSLAYLKHGNCFDAFTQASACITLDPSYAKAYFRRAEALKKCLDSKKTFVATNFRGSYSSVVQSYCEGNMIELNPKAFADAVMVSVDHNEQASIYHNDKAPSSFYTNTLMELVSRSDVQPKHLHYLVCTMWSLREYSAAGISLKHLITNIGVTELPLIQRLIELGMPVKKTDLSAAIRILKADNSKHLYTFKHIVSKCSQSDLDRLCIEASVAKKIPFVFCFIEHGAKSPGNSIELLEYALKVEDYIVGMDLVRSMPKSTVKKIDLGELIDTNLVRAPKLVRVLIDSGVSPNGLRRKSPIVVALSMEYLPIRKRCEIVCELLSKGADCNHLCRMKKGSTTPLHVATEIALQADGHTALITAVLNSPTFNSKRLTNDKQETPLHIAVKSHRRREPSTNVLKALLEPGLIDPSRKDRSGKRPVDLLSRSDSRVKILEAVVRNFKSSSTQHKKKQRNKTTTTEKATEKVPTVSVKQNESKETPDIVDETPQVKPAIPLPPVVQEPKVTPYNKLSLPEKFQRNLDWLLSKGLDYFVIIAEQASSDVEVATKDSVARTPLQTNQSNSPLPDNKLSEDKEQPSTKHLKPVPREVSPEPFQDSEDMNTVFSQLGFDLDNLPWEVEGTERVVKFFKDLKRNSENDRVCAARVIFSLAEGKRNRHLAKPVSSEPGLSLYEARMTKAARLLWEKAISYSSKLTGLSPTPVYTQVIRIWEVVLDHDVLDRRIKGCTELIEASYKRGRQASVRWSLLPQDSVVTTGVRGREMIEVPMRFLLPGHVLEKIDYEFIPAASTKENEYNITTFVSFDTIAFKSMLLGTNERRDFPFKEWQKEHEIIKLCSKEAILLLGRSGTGKTTCCLYRLWNEFKGFWNPQSPTYDCKLPRRVLVSPVTIQEVNKDEPEEEVWDSCNEDFEESDSETEHTMDRQNSSKSTDSRTELPSRQSSLGSDLSPSEAVQIDEDIEAIDITPTSSRGLIEEDLHQVFVTKNYVLCDQIKKRFFNMVAAHDFLEKHMEFESTGLPNSFSDIENLAYPIFLTARQFYILLDNSLGDGNTFFRRDSEGNLNVKISSLDYDHEDAEILLDLEESDSEDEEDTNVSFGGQAFEPHVAKQHAERWTEVTALYFKEMVWPAVSHQCQISVKDFDPLLVWIEIQSFIKGSEGALRKGAPLSLSEYQELGNKMAPNFSHHRETIFKVFEKYKLYLQKSRHREFLFDECDLMLHLYKRLKEIKDVPWSLHSIYIDEVQDFTQAELAVLIHCCRDPNSMFFTGDTAQSIMRGIAFRFQDLRTLFHRIHGNASLVRVPHKPHSLTINFRSHSGILKLAGSVIDLISEFFKDSIDHLPDDEGMFPGPTPVLVESCEVDELALLLSANKRRASAIEFGAHQAIIVQSKESKERLPDILKGAIVLTIFEAKGLEFDDVLLYNFFTDSLVDEKGWRVISSYLQMTRHGNKILNISKLPGTSGESRSRPFDPKLHKSLNAELKYLYTAITRTKCNLWIYDSNQKMRLPMFDYWYKRELVKVVRTGSPSDIEGMYNLVFASNSTTDQWKAQGDNFRKKHLWEQARLCYERAGDENEYLVKEAQAYQLIQNARQQRPGLYFEAAVRFLECDYLHHSTHYINAAALCLRNARPPKHSSVAKLYEMLGDSGKACQAYLRARDFDSFIRIKEAENEYSSVIRTLLGKPFMRKRDALMKAQEYEALGIELDPELSASELSYSCAKFYSERRDRDTLVDVLQYMPEMEKRVRFLKEAKLYDKAYTDYQHNEQYKDAYRLASAQGWYERGKSLARSVNDSVDEAVFILQRAKRKYKHHVAKESTKKETRTTSQIIQDMGQDVIDDLVYLMDRGKKQKNITSTCATLLLGMITADKGLCRLAWRTFKHLKHKIGTMEAFNQLQELADESIQSVLEECHLAKEVGKTFSNAKDINNIVQQGLKLYDLHKFGLVYCTPKDQDVWVTDIVEKCLNEQEKFDIDGMLRLDAAKVRECISKHCTEYLHSWVNHFQLDSKIPAKCDSFKLNQQLRGKKYLEREYSPEEVSIEALRRYVQSCMEYLELRVVMDKNTDGLVSLLLALFSPQVSRYLPQRFNETHIAIVRRSTHTHATFRTWVKETTLVPAKNFPERVSVDYWLTSWRACCLFSPEMKFLFNTLSELEAEANKKAKTDGVTPPGFVYRTKDSSYYHIFSMWLISCNEIRDNCSVLWASRLAIFHFLGQIAASKTVSISVNNMVDILSIHCTALLSIVTHVRARQNKTTSLAVPLLYKSTVQLFDNMLTHKENHWKLLRACVHEINSKPDRAIQRYFLDSRMLLIRSLDILLGTYKHAPWFCVLKFSLKNRPQDDVTRHCLILALTLFGNLIMLIEPQQIQVYHDKLVYILTRIQSKQDDLPDYVATTVDALRKLNFGSPLDVFRLVDYLLRLKKGKNPLAKLVFKAAGKHSKIEFVPMQQPPPKLEPPRMSGHHHQLPPRFSQQQSRLPPQPTPPSLPPSMPSSSPAPQFPVVQSSVTSTLPYPTPGAQAPIGTGRQVPSYPPGHSLPPQVPLQFSQPLQQPGMFPTAFPLPQSSMGGTEWPNITRYPGLPFGASSQQTHLQQVGYAPTESTFQPSFPQPPIGMPPALVPPTNANLPVSVQAHVVDSCSIDELKKLNQVTVSTENSTQLTAEASQGSEFDDFDFTYDSELEQSQNVGTTGDQIYIESEEDEEFDQALTVGETDTQAQHTVDPEMVDPSIVTQGFCSACGVSLLTEASDELEEELDVTSTETYTVHIRSESHGKNTILCKRFLSIVDSEDADVSYPRLAKKLDDLVFRCEKLKVSTDTERLDKTIDSIKVDRERNAKRLTDVQERLAWREGIQALARIVETMDRQLYAGEKIFEDVAREASSRGVYSVDSVLSGQVDEPDQMVGELEMLSKRYDDDDVLEVKGKMRSATDKQVSRQKKKERKEKQRGRSVANRKK